MKQITQTDYDPDDELQALLAEVLQEATITYGDEHELPLVRNLRACSATTALSTTTLS